MASIILIHGGGHGAWCWERVLAPLRAHGHEVQAIDLPGRGATADQADTVTLADWVAAVGAAVAGAAETPWLVGHSMGGLSSSQFAERNPDAIRGVIYVSAIVPGNGAAGVPTLDEAGPDCVLLQEGVIVPAPDGKTATASPDFAPDAFYGRCSPEDVQAALARLCPEPLLPLMTPLELGDGFASVSKTYIGATEDRAVPPGLQRRLAEQAGAAFQTIDSDHSPFLSATDALVAQLHALVG
jgi:pimeloyl-ACP methyl ester carboxylesterase